MDLGLKGKVAIVGGGSMGIGFGIANRLANEGADLVIFARRIAKLEKAAQDISTQYGVRVIPVAADIRDKDESTRIVQAAIDAYGRLDILVNNDGAPPLGAIDTFDDVAWQKAIEQNLFSVIRMVRSALPHLKASGSGSILNISADSAHRRLCTVGCDLGWAHRLREDFIDGDRPVRHQRQHHLSGLYRHRPSAKGFCCRYRKSRNRSREIDHRNPPGSNRLNGRYR